MTRRSSGAVLRQIHTLFTAGSCNGFSDRQLLERFVAHRDAAAELAFTALVERHGPMVLGVCRRILADSHDAEDAFQATFLVLVRRAGSIRVDGSLGRWLFGVATRVATRARANTRRRLVRERSGLDRIDAESPDRASRAVEAGDIQSILAEELGKLPARFQAPIVLCDLEGSSHEAAAQLLGCPVGTIKSRLSRGRARLRMGLIRRGLAPPNLSATVLLFPVAIPRRLVEATSQAARALVLGRLSTTPIISAAVARLTEGALRTMLFAKLRLVAAAMLLTVGASAVLVSQATAQKPSAPLRAIEKPDGAATVVDDVLDLEMLERAWVDAVNRHDVAVVGRIIADDFAGVDSAGGRSTKTSYLLDVRDGAFGSEPSVQEEVKIRLFGDCAVATSRIKLETAPTWNGLTNVYVKRQGRWLCVASQATWIRRDQGREPAPASNSPDEQIMNTAEAATRQLLYQPYTIPEFRTRTVQFTRIRPRFKCLVEKIRVRAGQSIKKGAALFELSSTELATAKSDYRTKKGLWEHDRTLLQTRQTMSAADEISRRLLAASQHDESRSLLEFQIAEGKVKSLGLDNDAIKGIEKEEDERVCRLTLRSPIDGTVLEVGAEVGGLYDTKRDLMLIVPASGKW